MSVRFCVYACSWLLLLAGCQQAESPDTRWVKIAAGSVQYVLPGSVTVVSEQLDGFAIMQRQVSQREYAACVEAGGCAALASAGRENIGSDLPAVGLNWHDAAAYARWWSERRGERYRLPRYGEWLLAAGITDAELAPLPDDPRDPSRRWLAEYEREAQRAPASFELRPFGAQGSNASGLLDVAGNVWEWTDSCLAQSPDGLASEMFCGIRIAAGRHPSVLSDFVRDPLSGACSVGAAPTYLGVRLIRED